MTCGHTPLLTTGRKGDIGSDWKRGCTDVMGSDLGGIEVSAVSRPRIGRILRRRVRGVNPGVHLHRCSSKWSKTDVPKDVP
jgi:hypothetical protein